jgi:hypothetical protein
VVMPGGAPARRSARPSQTELAVVSNQSLAEWPASQHLDLPAQRQTVHEPLVTLDRCWWTEGGCWWTRPYSIRTSLLVAGPTIRLTERHAKVRRDGYHRSSSAQEPTGNRRRWTDGSG